MDKPNTFQTWILASRPRTLPAAISPVVAGTAMAFYDGVFRLGPALAALSGALLLQIGANLANDVFDYQKGADTKDRLGPMRVTQAGLLTPAQVKTGMAVVFALATICGLYLTWQAGWPVVVIGLLSILSALAYTGGPYPLGYHGLGEVFVFIFFGLAGTCGTYFVQSTTFSWSSLWIAIPIGLLTVGILVVNNLRDIQTDRASGKHTLAAKFGEEWTRREYLAVQSGAYLIPLAFWLMGELPVGVILSWASLPLLVPLVKTVYTVKGRPLNKALGGTGQLEIVFSLCLAAGLILQKLIQYL